VDRVEQTPGRAFLLCGRLEEVRAALERDDSNEERGVFKTVDGGKTWTKALYIDPDTGYSDLDLDPSNPRVVYAAMYTYRRKLWRFDSGGGATACSRSPIPPGRISCTPRRTGATSI
jgi:hypothetical protein